MSVSSVSALKDFNLPDVFAMVPNLLETCVCSWSQRGACIRALRLVSREFASIALTAVQSCAVQIGEEALPNPKNVTQLFRSALLHSMDLTVCVKAGKC